MTEYSEQEQLRSEERLAKIAEEHQLAELRGLMADRSSRYWQGKDAPRLQERYRHLIRPHVERHHGLTEEVYAHASGNVRHGVYGIDYATKGIARYYKADESTVRAELERRAK